MDQEILPVPEEGGQDYALKAAKGALGAFPLVGGLMGELVTMCIEPNYQKRMREWMEATNMILTQLIESGISKEEIFENEKFQSLFVKSSKIYMENIEEYKKPLLRAAFQSAIISNLALDKKYIFLDMVAQLTETQLMILKGIYDNEQLYETGTHLYGDALREQFSERYTGGDFHYYELLQHGLENFRLLNHAVTDPAIENNNRVEWHLTTSTIGKEFIEYIDS
ncbi:hypothetical protein [Chitinophaga niabensis]|uniref:Uncharacterized protein n=1 Tax=Chitinophaga niabensis TaxID=536979 RepID=A0A1N6KAQ8_9BACT|nr:hypothetical protein [Chitinophaga niabensis]SIO53679.1 hypothetical protein SAMN04488055_5459 [Chitinophaga niabensis]